MFSVFCSIQYYYYYYYDFNPDMPLPKHKSRRQLQKLTQQKPVQPHHNAAARFTRNNQQQVIYDCLV